MQVCVHVHMSPKRERKGKAEGMVATQGHPQSTHLQKPLQTSPRSWSPALDVGHHPVQRHLASHAASQGCSGLLCCGAGCPLEWPLPSLPDSGVRGTPVPGCREGWPMLTGTTSLRPRHAQVLFRDPASVPFPSSWSQGLRHWTRFPSRGRGGQHHTVQLQEPRPHVDRSPTLTADPLSQPPPTPPLQRRGPGQGARARSPSAAQCLQQRGGWLRTE